MQNQLLNAPVQQFRDEQYILRRTCLVHFVTTTDSFDEQLEKLLSELGRYGPTALQEIKGLFQ